MRAQNIYSPASGYRLRVRRSEWGYIRASHGPRAAQYPQRLARGRSGGPQTVTAASDVSRFEVLFELLHEPLVHRFAEAGDAVNHACEWHPLPAPRLACARSGLRLIPDEMEEKPIQHLSPSGFLAARCRRQLIDQQLGAGLHKLQVGLLEPGLFGDLSIGGVQRLFALVESALWQLPRAGDVRALDRQDVALVIHDHRAGASAKVLGRFRHAVDVISGSARRAGR